MKPFFKKKPVKEQMTPFKDLTFSEKVHYIWEYYKYFMLAAVLVIIAVVSFVISFQRNNYTTAFSMSDTGMVISLPKFVGAIFRRLSFNFIPSISF